MTADFRMLLKSSYPLARPSCNGCNTRNTRLGCSTVQARHSPQKPRYTVTLKLLILRVPCCRKNAPQNQMFLMRTSPADRLRIDCDSGLTLYRPAVPGG